MGAHYIQMGLLKILPDTPIRRSAGEYGYRYCAAPPYSVLANRWLDQQDLGELYWFSECVEKFYNNRYFVTLWRYLRERDEDIAGFFQELLAVCRRHDFFRLAATQEFMGRLLCEAVAGAFRRRASSLTCCAMTGCAAAIVFSRNISRWPVRRSRPPKPATGSTRACPRNSRGSGPGAARTSFSARPSACAWPRNRLK